MKDVDAFNDELKSRRGVGIRRWAARAQHGHDGAFTRGGRGADDRWPLRRGEGAHRRAVHHQRDGPGRGARLGAPRRPRPPSFPSRSVPSRSNTRAEVLVSGLPVAAIERLFSRGVRTGRWAVLVRGFGDIDPSRRRRCRTAFAEGRAAVGGGRSAPQPPSGGSSPPARHPGDQSPPPRIITGGPPDAGGHAFSAVRSRGEVGPVQDDRLRLIFTCCHPALSPQRAGSAHPAAPGRPDPPPRSRGRFLVPESTHGPAAGPGEREDPRCPDSLPHSRGRRICLTA